MRDRAALVAPFAFDTWPLCEPWERAGRATLWDRLEVARWAELAELELRLEIDRRFDQLADQLELELEPRRPRID
jgi:hypothetical protein